MARTITILFILFIGIFASSNSAFACSERETKKELTTNQQYKHSKSDQSNCCNNQTKGIGHDCNKKCKNHNCDCTTISSFSFLNKNLQAEVVILTYSAQNRFSLYKPLFSNNVYISIWHPPKIV